MKTKTLSRNGGKTYALILETGDEVITELTRFARDHGIRAAHFTGLGAFSSALLAYFDWETKRYLDLPVADQVEVIVLTGDIAWKGDEPVAHVHTVLGRRDGSTRGGHLQRGFVRPTLELSLEEAGALERRFDPESGLALIA